MTDEPKKWGFKEPYDASAATEAPYSYDKNVYPQSGGRILQSGINADGHVWFLVSVFVLDVKDGQTVSLGDKWGGRDHRYPREGTHYAIIEFASHTLARARFFSVLQEKADSDPKNYFMSDWIVVNIRRQQNKNLAVGNATVEAVKLWRRTPMMSGKPITSHLYYNPLKTYDDSFHGL